MHKKVSWIFLFFASFWLWFALVWYATRLPVLSTEGKLDTQSVATQSAQPNFIIFPRLGVNHQVKAARVSNNDWELFESAISWAKDSGDLAGGNMVMYGHNYLSLLGKVRQSQVGDIMVIGNRDQQKMYQVIASFQGSPEDVALIRETKTRLTLYTCDGWLDQYRWFVIAEPL